MGWNSYGTESAQLAATSPIVCPNRVPASLRLSGAGYVEVLETICNSLAEGEDVALDARLEEGDLEGAVRDRSRLPDQLIQPLVHHRAVALFVDVESARFAGRLTVDEHAEGNGGPWRPWTQDQVDVARVEAERDPPAGFVQHARASLDRPVPRESPLVEPQAVKWDIRSHEVLSLVGAEVGLR